MKNSVITTKCYRSSCGIEKERLIPEGGRIPRECEECGAGLSLTTKSLTVPQRKSLYKVWKNKITDGRSYREFRKSVRIGIGGDCVMVNTGSIWLGIEFDGYTHS